MRRHAVGFTCFLSSFSWTGRSAGGESRATIPFDHASPTLRKHFFSSISSRHRCTAGVL